MKTPQQFAKWLDKQTQAVGKHLDSVDEFDIIVGPDLIAIVAEAHRHAADVGLDLVPDLLPAREVLGKYRAQVRELVTDEPLTVNEAAARLGLSIDAVYDLCKSGRLQHERMGRAIRIRPEWLQNLRKETARGGRRGRCLK